MAATVQENLRALFLGTSSITTLVEDRVCNNVPSTDDGDGPLIFIQLTDTDDEPYLDAPEGLQPFRYVFAIECWAPLESEAASVAKAVKGLNLHEGAFGDSTVQGIFVENANEDYVPKGDASESGWHGVFLNCEVVPA